MPSVSASRIMAASREEVWAALADIESARRWNTAWSSIEITSAQRQGPGTTFRARSADGESYDFAITEWLAPEYIAFSPVRDDSQRYSITLESHAFRLRPAGEDRTEVELSARASARGLRGRIVALLFWPGHQKQGLNTALDSLQAIFEPGEKSEPEAGAASAGG